MIINTDSIKSVLDSKVTGNYIESECNVTKAMVSKYRSGKQKVENMTLGTAIKLQKFYDEHKDDQPKTDLKITGIRSAVSAFNDWQGAARVYFNKSEMKVWTNIYADGNSWDDYHDDDIVEIANKISILSRDAQITMREIRELVVENNDSSGQ